MSDLPPPTKWNKNQKRMLYGIIIIGLFLILTIWNTGTSSFINDDDVPDENDKFQTLLSTSRFRVMNLQRLAVQYLGPRWRIIFVSYLILLFILLVFLSLSEK
jgi:uncharacterized integral membrane protein